MPRRLFPLIALLLIFTACGPASQGAQVGPLPTRFPTESPDSYGLDGAERVARTFLDSWMAGDFENMYSLLSFTSRDATPFESFRALYESSQAEMRMTGLTYQANAISRDETNNTISYLDYDMAFVTSILGTFTDTHRTLTLVIDSTVDDWSIAWSAGDIFAEMRGGGRLLLQAQLPQRGNIYDRNGEVMADQNGAIVTIHVVRQEIPQLDACLSTLVQATGDPLDIIQNRLNAAGMDWLTEVGLIEATTYQQYRDALERDCNATFDSRPARRYINGTIAPHILGTVGYPGPEDIPAVEAAGFEQDSIMGRTGIEASWDEALRGQPGGSLIVTTPDGTVLREIARSDPQPSRSVYLTLDMDLQAYAQGLLRQYYDLNPGTQSRGGSVVVLNVNTGEILALATWPTYDGNILLPYPYMGREAADALLRQLENDPRLPLLNRPTQGQYPAGSTFKVVTAAAAADSGVYALDQRYTCSGVWEEPGDITRYDWLPGGHGTLTLAGGIANSCNPYFYEAGYQLHLFDPMVLPTYARRMGYGAPTGLTDIAESPGVIRDPEQVRIERGYNEAWSVVDSVSMAIGQGIGVEVTPLQMARLYAAIANGGALYRPQLVESVRLVDDISYEMQPEVNGLFGISEEVLDVVQQGLCAVPTEIYGTAYFVFRDSPLQALGVCGKTGTAQDSSASGNSHAWFAGYAPRDNPEIVVLAMVENGGEGSEVAAPIVRDFMEYYFFGEDAP